MNSDVDCRAAMFHVTASFILSFMLMLLVIQSLVFATKDKNYSIMFQKTKEIRTQPSCLKGRDAAVSNSSHYQLLNFTRFGTELTTVYSQSLPYTIKFSYMNITLGNHRLVYPHILVTEERCNNAANSSTNVRCH